MQDSKSYLRILTIIYFAMAATQTLFAIAVFVQIQKTAIIIDPAADDLIIPFFAFLFMAVGVGPYLYKKLIDQAQGKTLTEKLNQFRTAIIIRYATIEGPSLFGIVAYYLSGNLIYLLISALLIVYFLTLKPTKEKLEKDLNFDYKEKEQFDRRTSL